jgi:choice-of-anchor B domain-containing protein
MFVLFDQLLPRRGKGYARPWLAALFILALVPEAAEAQGIHISLRANPTPNSRRRYADVWASGNYAYVGSDQTSGVFIFDISNPDAPRQVFRYNPANSTDMEDVKVANGIGYFASNVGGGVHIVDLSNPASPVLITRITSATGGYDNVHNVALDGAHLYIPNYGPGGSPAVQVWDVSTPASPVFIRTITTTDTVAIHDLTVQNNRLYTAGNGSSTDIWDVTNVDTTAPTLLASIASGNRTASAVPTADDKYLFVTRELFSGAGNLSVYDISNLPATPPTLVYQTTGAPIGLDATSAFQPKVVGNLLYLTWDQAGLVVFDISNPASPVMIGNYDTWPGAVNPNAFDGAWGVYPFLGQDRVLVTDRDSGLFVLDATGVSAQPALLNLRLNPATVTGTVFSAGQVFLVGLGSSPNGTIIDLSSDTAAASPPVNVTVPPGGTTANFTVSTSTVPAATTATITASDGTFSKTAQLTIHPGLATLAFNPAVIVSGASTSGTVTFSAPVTADTAVAVNIVSGSSAVASIPSSVTVLNGTASSNFVLTANAVTSDVDVGVSAKAGSVTVTNSVRVLAPDFTLEIDNSPQSILASGQGTFTGILTSIAGYASPVNLSCSAGSTNPPATCTISSAVTPSPGGTSFSITVADLTAATYQFNVRAVGTDPVAVTHSKAVVLDVGPDFQMDNSSGAQTVRAGGSAQYGLNFAPVGAATFPNAVTYTCSSLPALSSCSFSPSQIGAGSGATAVTLTVTTTAPMTSRLWFGGATVFGAFWIFGPAFGLVLMRGLRRTTAGRRTEISILLGVLLAAASIQVSCGGGGGGGTTPPPRPGTAPGQYTVSVNTTSGAIQHTTSLTLTVQ